MHIDKYVESLGWYEKKVKGWIGWMGFRRMKRIVITLTLRAALF